MKQRLIWYLKQLFPLTYRTRYIDQADNKHFIVWNMWFGRCFNIEDAIIKHFV